MKTLYIICLAFAVISCGDKPKESGDTNQETQNNDSLSIAEGVNPEASAELRWMEKIADVDWIENGEPDHKLIFRKPTSQSGSLKGDLEEHFPGLVNFGKYDSNSEGVLNIQLLKTIREGVEEQRSSTANLKLSLADENTLVINYPDGRTLSYKRSQKSNSPKETKTGSTPEPNNATLWMNKIEGDWKNIMNAQIVRFNKPLQQGETIKGEVEMHEESFIQVFRYERTADGQMKCKLLRFKITGDESYTEENTGKESDASFKTELLDEGNTLVLHHSNGTTYTYKR